MLRPALQRLTAEDQVMLWPDETWPQDIGALAILDAGSLVDADGGFRIEAMREHIGRRLHRVPRFRQLLYVPPKRLGGPLWVDAATVDLTDHVRCRPVPHPGDEAQLLQLVEEIRKKRLDRTRPLWEMVFLTGLPERRIGLFVRMHHTIADGMASLATVMTFLDHTPTAVAADAPSWTPSPMPTEQELRADERRRQRQRLRHAVATVAHPITTARGLAAAGPALRELVAERPPPVTSLHRVVGPDRTLALMRSDLELVKQVAERSDATVNDVLLAVTAGGLRGLLRSRGETVEGVTVSAYVPVSLHREAAGSARGNLIAQMTVPLPTGIADPLERLHAITLETALRKKRVRPSLGSLPHGLLGRVFLALVRRQRVNVTSADMHGPSTPMYLAGARVLEVFPMVQLIGTVSLAVGALSYAGQFNVMVVADATGYPDIEVFVSTATKELRALRSDRGRAAP